MPINSDIATDYLESEVARGLIPGAQYVIGEDLRVVAEDALGLAVLEPDRLATTFDTIYDMASLTKPLITALLIIKLVERKLVELDAPISRYLHEFDDNDKREIAIIELLTHTSGLPNWLPLYLEAEIREEVPAAIARILVEPRTPATKEVVYSDLNYILLGFLLERVTGEQLDRLAEQEIFKPLRLIRTMFNPAPDLVREIAATERGQKFELSNAVADAKSRNWGDHGRLAAEVYSSAGLSHARWRKDVIWGQVHDGNANFMGGVAGHAGLFSTAREAFKISNQFLAGSELLKPESLDLFARNLTPGRSTSRSIAWILAETPDCSAGPALPPTAFGHNGFTGTSIWIDPTKRRVLVLLTNRVHPQVHPIDMKEIRRRFNTLAIQTLDSCA